MNSMSQHVDCIIVCACDTGIKSCVKQKLPSLVPLIGSVCVPKMIFLMLSVTFIILYDAFYKLWWLCSGEC
jgi:hypothetical protein